MHFMYTICMTIENSYTTLLHCYPMPAECVNASMLCSCTAMASHVSSQDVYVSHKGTKHAQQTATFMQTNVVCKSYCMLKLGLLYTQGKQFADMLRSTCRKLQPRISVEGTCRLAYLCVAGWLSRLPDRQCWTAHAALRATDF